MLYHNRAAAHDDEVGPVDVLLSLQMVVVNNHYMLSSVAVHVMLNAVSDSRGKHC